MNSKLTLLNILYEIFDQPYDVKYKQSERPKLSNDQPVKWIKKDNSVFFAENHKLMIEVFQYPNDFYFVSYYPSLNKDFRRSPKQPNKYRIKLNFKNPYRVLGTVMNYMKTTIYDKNNNASFGFYGAPDKNDSDPEFTIDETARYRVYKTMSQKFFGVTHDIVVDPAISAIMVISKEKIKEYPQIKQYGTKVMEIELR